MCTESFLIVVILGDHVMFEIVPTSHNKIVLMCGTRYSILWHFFWKMALVYKAKKEEQIYLMIGLLLM